MTGAVYVAAALVALQRAAELVLAWRNERRLRARGAVEHGAAEYKLIVALHTGWLVALSVAVPAEAEPDLWLIALYLALQPLRYWAVASLGERWTTRVLVVPGARTVARGPYRFLRHPNYLVVALEIPLLPLAFGAWQLAAVFGLLNLALLGWRIRVEDSALGRAGAAASLPGAPLDRNGMPG